MMRIGLIDVDSHRFPNLALMKISAYHKAKGDTVEWCLPIMPYDIVYQSKVFDETYSADIDYIPLYVMVYDKPNAPKEIRLLQRWCNNIKIQRSCPRFEDYDPKKG